MSTKKIFKKYYLLITLLLFALVLRIWLLDKTLFFGFEQGRDLLAVKNILSGDPVLVGAWTSIPGLFHGAFSYWMLVPLSFLSGGDPFLITVMLIIANIIGLVLLYAGLQKLYDQKIALISIALLVFSYTSIIYSRWLSNPNITPLLFGGIIYSLASAKKNERYLIFTFAFWAAMIHFQIAVAVALLPPILITVYLCKIKFQPKTVAASLLVVGLILSSYLVFDLRNSFLMSRSLLQYAFNGLEKVASGSGDPVLNMVNPIADEITRALVPQSKLLSLIMFVGSVVGLLLKRKNRLDYIPLIFLVFSILPFVLLKQHPLYHYLMLIHILVYLLLAISMARINKPLMTLTIVLLVIGSNFYYYFQKIPANESIFLYPSQRTYLGGMKKIIDYIYEDADGKVFTYDYYTIPYWQEEAWVYLFQWHGNEKYGYAPKVDRTNVERSEIFYTIIEPNTTDELHQNNWYGEYKKDLELLDSYEAGDLRVEKRKVLNNDVD